MKIEDLEQLMIDTMEQSIPQQVKGTITKDVEYCYEKKTFYDFVKRSCDIVLSFAALVVLLPLLLAISVVIAASERCNPLFLQKRMKKNGRKFSIIKFRTMVKGADEIIELLPDEMKKQYEYDYRIPNDPRVTRLGRFLRATCIDELPQLINILKGDMSIVGPRPILEKELEMYGDNKQLLLSVRPGLTGFWQASTADKKSYANGERQHMELYYVEKRSVKLDAYIILKTVKTILYRCFHRGTP